MALVEDGRGVRALNAVAGGISYTGWTINETNHRLHLIVLLGNAAAKGVMIGIYIKEIEIQ